MSGHLTVVELQPAIGAAVAVRFEEITVQCTVVDAKRSWGHVRIRVEPKAGSGSQWVELDRVVESHPLEGLV